MSAPFDRGDYQIALVMLDYLVVHEVPLSRDARRALERLMAATPRPDCVRFAPSDEPTCRRCGALLAAERTVQVTDTVTATRRLYECGAVEDRSDDAGHIARGALAPCGDTERRVAADLAGAEREAEPVIPAVATAMRIARDEIREVHERTDGRGREAQARARPPVWVRVSCDDCDGVGGITLVRDGEQAVDRCVRCGGTGWLDGEVQP